MSNGIPILGGPKLRMGTQISAIPRRLDENGTYEAAGVQTLPDGSVRPLNRRGDYMDADDLIEAIRAVVREELAAFRAD